MKKDERLAVRTELVDLTENQARLFKTVLNLGTAPVEEAGLSGHGAGRVASSLQEKGYIEPMGRVGRQVKWVATPTWEDRWNKYRKDISSVLELISEKK